MARKSLFSSRQPVLGGAHGGTVPHETLGTFISHHVFLDIALVVLLAVLIVMIAMTVQSSLATQRAASVPVVLPAEYYAYDPVERVRLNRLLSADRSYDSVEAVRAGRLAAAPLAVDHTYDSVENVRAGRVLVAPLAADHSYDAIETIRQNRSAGH